MWVIREPAESEDRYFDRHFRRQGRVLWSVVSKTVDRSNHENGYFSFILCIAGHVHGKLFLFKDFGVVADWKWQGCIQENLGALI